MSEELIAREYGDEAVLWVPGRPATINSERSGTIWAHREKTEQGRWSGLALAASLKKQGYEFPERAEVTSWPQYRHKPWPDVGNWVPALKAIVDGLVDAGAWPDDTAKYVGRITYDAPTTGPSDGLYVLISPYTERYRWAA